MEETVVKELSKLCPTFGGIGEALQQVNVSEAELAAVGPAGCGTSTCLRADSTQEEA